MEQHGLCARLFEAVNGYLQEKRLLMRHGTIVDAMIVAALSSTKNRAGQRDPEMQQTKKGKQWYFGMKAQKIKINSLQNQNQIFFRGFKEIKNASCSQYI